MDVWVGNMLGWRRRFRHFDALGLTQLRPFWPILWLERTSRKIIIVHYISRNLRIFRIASSARVSGLCRVFWGWSLPLDYLLVFKVVEWSPRSCCAFLLWARAMVHELGGINKWRAGYEGFHFHGEKIQLLTNCMTTDFWFSSLILDLRDSAVRDLCPARIR